MLNWKNENMNRKKRKTRWEMVINNMYLCFSIHFSFISWAFWWSPSDGWVDYLTQTIYGEFLWTEILPLNPQSQETSQSDGFSLHLYPHSVILSLHRNLHRVKEFSVLFFIMMFWWKLVLLYPMRVLNGSTYRASITPRICYRYSHRLQRQTWLEKMSHLMMKEWKHNLFKMVENKEEFPSFSFHFIINRIDLEDWQW